MRSAWIVQGGWQGHQPQQVADLLAGELRQEGFAVTVFNSLDCFFDTERLGTASLIVPCWTMGEITQAQLTPFLTAVRSGAGCAGLHGGMGDAFRNEPEYQFMVGGQWVAHPGNDGVTYQVQVADPADPVMTGSETLTVTTEQYYMHVDPANHVLATTQFGDVTMPVVWKKHYGQGRVFYCSLGHQVDVVAIPQVLTWMRRGMVWAARGDS